MAKGQFWRCIPLAGKIVTSVVARLRQNPQFVGAGVVSVVLVTLVWFVPFPVGYLLCLGVWWLTAKGILELPPGRAGLLFGVLAALSFVARLALLGALGF